MSLLAVTIDVLLLVVFASSAGPKVLRQSSRQALILSLRSVVPGHLVRRTAAALTTVEAAVTLGLGLTVAASATGLPARAPVAMVSLSASAFLSLLLTIGVAVAVGRRSDVVCACFGTASGPLGTRHIFRNALLFAASLASMVVHSRLDPPSSSWAVISGVVLGTVLAACLINIDSLSLVFGTSRRQKTNAQERISKHFSPVTRR